MVVVGSIGAPSFVIGPSCQNFRVPVPSTDPTRGWAGFRLRAEGVDTALWLDPPPKKERAQLTGPQIPTEPDPRAPEVTWTQNSAKTKMGFSESARRGVSEKSSFCMYLVKKIDHFQCLKQLSSPSAPEFIITDQWSCLLSSFPEAPLPQFWGALLKPPPPPSS